MVSANTSCSYQAHPDLLALLTSPLLSLIRSERSKSSTKSTCNSLTFHFLLISTQGEAHNPKSGAPPPPARFLVDVAS